MPKKHKTRKQKIQAEQRKNTSVEDLTSTKTIKTKKPSSAASRSQQSEASPTYPLPVMDTITATPQTAVAHHTNAIVTKGYETLTKDIRKTAVVTGAIVLVQLLVYFLI